MFGVRSNQNLSYSSDVKFTYTPHGWVIAHEASLRVKNKIIILYKSLNLKRTERDQLLHP